VSLRGFAGYLLGVLDGWLMWNLKMLYYFQNFSMLAKCWRHASMRVGQIFGLKCWRYCTFWSKYLTSELFFFYCGCTSSNFNHSLHQNTACHCPNHTLKWIYSFINLCNTRRLFERTVQFLTPERIRSLCFWSDFCKSITCSRNT
jgi:hypothetical protein